MDKSIFTAAASYFVLGDFVYEDGKCIGIASTLPLFK